MKDPKSLTEVSNKQNRSTGFQSAGDDFASLDLNLQQKLVQHPNSTFFFRLNSSLPLADQRKFKLRDKILVVDKSLIAQPSDLVIANNDGELVAAYLPELATRKQDQAWEIWGVVTSVIYCLK